MVPGLLTLIVVWCRCRIVLCTLVVLVLTIISTDKVSFLSSKML